VLSKIIELEDRFPSTGEPTLMVVSQHGRSGLLREKRALASSASPALEYIQNVTPKEGSSFVLVNALGAFETYDDNRNGDGFPELTYNVGKPAPCGHKECQTSNGWIAQEETLTRHYETFEKFGGIYEHHVNKDPSKSLGKILKAFWNSRMHRVELLLELINERKPELITRINDGDYPAVSMGCHVRWDVCSVCGHRAPTRKEYCDHLRFEMRKIDPRTGVRYCALNPSPRFFDISIVVRPADTTGFMLKKVASEGRRWWPGADLGAKVSAFNDKQAQVRKLSEMQKDLVGDVMGARLSEEGVLIKNYRKSMIDPALAERPEAGAMELGKMARYSLPEALSTLAVKSAALSASEFATLFLQKCGYDASSVVLDKIAALQPVVNEVFAQYPDLYEKVASSVAMSADAARPALAAALGSWLQKRAGFSDWLGQQAHEGGGPLGQGAPFGPGAAYEAHAPPKTDTFTMTDPNTGEVYKTTRGAGQAADDTNYRSMLGGTALLSGAYALALGQLPGAEKLPGAARVLAGLALGAGTMYAGKTRLDPYEGGYQTDQGVALPGNTEFRKSGSLATPALLDKLALDYTGRVRARPGSDLGAALTGKIASSVGDRDPVVRLLRDPAPVSTKVARLFSSHETPSYNSTEAASLEFDQAASVLGSLLATH